eukprot:3034198-Amphidinium_carterae.1
MRFNSPRTTRGGTFYESNVFCRTGTLTNERALQALTKNLQKVKRVTDKVSSLCGVYLCTHGHHAAYSRGLLASFFTCVCTATGILSRLTMYHRCIPLGTEATSNVKKSLMATF